MTNNTIKLTLTIGNYEYDNQHMSITYKQNITKKSTLTQFSLDESVATTNITNISAQDLVKLKAQLTTMVNAINTEIS